MPIKRNLSSHSKEIDVDAFINSADNPELKNLILAKDNEKSVVELKVSKKTFKTVTLRLDEHEYHSLLALAKRENRSLQKQITYLISKG